MKYYILFKNIFWSNYNVMFTGPKWIFARSLLIYCLDLVNFSKQNYQSNSILYNSNFIIALDFVVQCFFLYTWYKKVILLIKNMHVFQNFICLQKNRFLRWYSFLSSLSYKKNWDIAKKQYLKLKLKFFSLHYNRCG